MKRRPVRMLLFTLVPLLLIVGILSLLTYRQMRQDRLNRTLIAALKAKDYPAALRALQQGADARTRDFPPDTRSFWKRLLERLQGTPSKASSNAPTALELLIVEPTGWYKHPGATVFEYHIPSLKDWETVLQALLKGGANPNDRHQIVYSNGPQPFFEYVVELYPADALKACFKYGLRLDVHSQEARTWLWLSLSNPDHEVTAFLLDRGINPNMRDKDGDPLLLDAVWGSSEDAVKALLDHGAWVNVKDRGSNALEEAGKFRKMMFKKGAPYQAADVKHMDTIITLLKAHGATSRSGH